MLNLLTAETNQLLQLHNGLNIVVTIGNSLRADDGLGPYIASCLPNQDNLVVIDAGSTPENFVDDIINLNPTYILFIDAANFGGLPGQSRLIAKDEISDLTLSTHMFPLSAIWTIIEQSIAANISFLGIQIQNTDFKEGLCNEVRQVADKIIESLLNNN